MMKGMETMELNDTVELMTSDDYKERFKAEYHQTNIRYKKLLSMIKKAEAGTLDFTPECPLSLLKKQSSVMANYLTLLDKRARIEGVDLSV